VGSVVLEQLLRLTRVARVYVLVRPRATKSAKKRLKALLAEDLFARVPPADRARAVVLTGDGASPGLGLSPSDAAAARSVDVVINCAAALGARSHVRTAVANNVLSTASLVDLALTAPRLRAFVHMSSAWVHGVPPAGAAAFAHTETLGPLPAGCLPARELAVQLRSMPPAAAAVEGEALRVATRQANNYMLTKLLAEHVVADAARRAGLPAVIVRPSYVGPACAAPHEGYFFGASGGMSLAAIAAMDHSAALPGADLAVLADCPLAVVPVDVAAAGTLAAAAAVAAGAARRVGGVGGDPLAIVNLCTSGTHPLTAAAAGDLLLDMPTAALALVKRMLGKGGAPPPELAPYWDSLREVVATRGEAAMHDIMRFDTSNLADLADRLAPGERDAAFPLRFGEGTATWETAVKASQKYGANLFKRR
jgi:fatty acyl-CoA reductase